MTGPNVKVHPTTRSGGIGRWSRRELLGAATVVAATPWLAAMAGCAPGGPDEVRSALSRSPAGDPGPAPEKVARFTSALASTVWQPGTNLVTSPLSVLMALAMVRNGAAGTTASELDEVLGIADLDAFNQSLNSIEQRLESRSRTFPDKRELTLAVANSLWGQQGLTFAEPFLDALATWYGAGMNVVDYAGRRGEAVTRINGWTKEATHGRIPTIVNESLVPTDTKLVLVNAVYFKAPWKEPFDKGRTRDLPFTRGDGTTVPAPTMIGEANQWYADDACQAARLSYLGDEIAMAVALPRKDVATTLRDWASGGLTRMLTGWQGASVDLELPKWDHQWREQLNAPLGQLGMPTAFQDSADFSAMTPEIALKISFVVHQATITVDELGTEAAAATAVGMRPTSGQIPQERQELHLDRPYLYVIHDIATATPIFVGVVADPVS